MTQTKYYQPNRLQVASAIKGEDRFVPRRRVSPFYVVMFIAAILLFGYVAYVWATGGA